MEDREYSGLLVSDFNIHNLAGYLDNDTDFPKVRTTVAPFGQVLPVWVAENSECRQGNYDFAVIWTQPQSVIPSFNRLLNYETVSVDDILREVDEFCSIMLDSQNRLNTAFVATWVLPSCHRGYGILDMKNGPGIANTLMRMNLRLSENLDKDSSFYVFNSQKWIENAGRNAFNAKLWYMAKIPFGNEVFKEATREIKTALRSIAGNARKLIILDLDNTLWGGIVGDLGWENLELGGHDHSGEAFVDFQKALKSLTNRGILLGIVSKNEESIALDAINNHPEMVLKSDDFVGWKINWQDKAQNIVDLVSDLNLGLQSVVFIDDNPVERARVRESLPEVFVPDWPEDAMLYKNLLLNLRCFDTVSITKEDRERTKLYVLERKRDNLKKRVSSIDEWLNTLNIKVKIAELDEANLQRAAQLLNKTNQMNLTTRRMTESQLLSWHQQDEHELWTFRVSDKFGDLGLTGLASLEVTDSKGRIIDFILSCRVMGRKIEEAMLHTVISHAQLMGLDEIWVEYIPTSKNKPCLEFFRGSGLRCNGEDYHFSYDLKDEYKLPDCVKIE